VPRESENDMPDPNVVKELHFGDWLPEIDTASVYEQLPTFSFWTPAFVIFCIGWALYMLLRPDPLKSPLTRTPRVLRV